MKLVVDQRQLVTCHRLVKLCDYVYAENIWHGGKFNTYMYDIARSIQNDGRKCVSIYCKIDFIDKLFSTLKRFPQKRFVLVTGMSDYPVTTQMFNARPPNVVYWFGENIRHSDAILESVPLGCTDVTWIGDVEYADLSNHPRYVKYTPNEGRGEQINLMFSCFTVGTNAEHRTVVAEAFKHHPWVTFAENIAPMEFLRNIDSHPFVLCPLGNGDDTGRFWQALYLGSIPVVPRHKNIEFYEGKLPMVVFNDPSEITKERLEMELQTFEKVKPTYEVATMDYWRSRIANKVREHTTTQ